MTAHRPIVHLRRLLVAGLVLATLIAHPSARASSSRTVTPPPAPAPAAVGADLWHLDRDNALTIQEDNGTRNVQLFAAPDGIPDRTGWRVRDLRLNVISSTATITPTDLPFALHLAATSAGPTLASLVSEDRVTLGIGLASINGAPPVAVPGQPIDNAVVYRAPVPSSSSDLSLAATTTGLNVGVVLHGATDSGPYVFALGPDPRTQLSPKADGAVWVTRAITGYGDTGIPYSGQQPEYILGAPILRDSNADPAGAVTSGPVSMTVVTSTSGQPQLALSIDPVWLHSPARVFPAYLQLPVSTSYAASHSQIVGTVTSCVPAAPAPAADLVVGTENGCTYHGLVRFDNVASLPPGSSIVSATLSLYTPGQTGPTGVLVYPNAPNAPASPGTASPLLGQQPSWNSAPVMMTGTTGLAQSDSGGQRQSWDVTRIVQGWAHDGRTNGGFTMASAASPVLFTTAHSVPATTVCSPQTEGCAIVPTNCVPAVYFCNLAPDPHPIPAGTVPASGQCDYARQVYNTYACVPPMPGQCGYVGANPNGVPPLYTIISVSTYQCVPRAPYPGNCTINVCVPGASNLLPRPLPNPCASSSLTQNCTRSLEPVLTVVYATPERTRPGHLPTPPLDATSSTYNDGQYSIIGFAGEYRPDGATCAGLCERTSMLSNFGVSYERSGLSLPCASNSSTPLSPGVAWWNGGAGPAHIPAYDTIKDSLSKGISPITQFGLDYSCLDTNGNTEYAQIRDFVSSIPPDIASAMASTSTRMYFEIGNEENIHSAWGSYKYIFMYMAHALQDGLSQMGINNYVILTNGVLQPTATPKVGCPIGGPQGQDNVDYIHEVTTYAEENGVDPGHLGVAVHPYGYDSGNNYNQYWQNYDQQYALGGVCFDMDAMIATWTSKFPNMPVVFTEINESDHGYDPVGLGFYLADLLTYLWDNDYSPFPYSSPLRVMIYRGLDTGGYLGIYDDNGNDKGTDVAYCPNDGTIQGSPTVSHVVNNLLNVSYYCY